MSTILDRPYVQGSRTSFAASCSIASGTGRASVMAALRWSPHGLTRDEVAAATGMSPNAVRPRVCELMARGLVRPSGEIRRSVTGMAMEVLEAIP